MLGYYFCVKKALWVLLIDDANGKQIWMVLQKERGLKRFRQDGWESVYLATERIPLAYEAAALEIHLIQ
ncbi:hypothetical protein SOMG_02712 [Schizosaccharomyces osmophilus]|uniref:Uncharacterized protein n=1 Tax=Schizosaccharomyces osmophilus TaxID=2545709 RepID=A0AAF0AWY7_9SCHI|nr:uncharacterized protein SOMG_02712 [Schizosaccharomyces osmophilus]WBW74237.1 hypothetical protein SOMG_02712 [Schizosaccharomyces osmophilus]